MQNFNKDKIIFLLLGIVAGMFLMIILGFLLLNTKSGFKFPTVSLLKNTLMKDDFFVSFEKDSDINQFEPQDGASSNISFSNVSHGNRSLMVNIPSNKEFPGIGWESTGKTYNWSNASEFQTDIFNNNETTVTINIKFKSGGPELSKTCEVSANLKPLSLNHIEIPMKDLNNCDISQISYIKFFVENPKNNLVLYFDRIGIRAPDKKDAIAAIKKNSPKTPLKNDYTLKEGSDIFAASALDKVLKNGQTISDPHFTQDVNLYAAKNEYESFQVVISNGKNPLSNLFIQISDLTSNKGQTFPETNFTWNIVGYVLTKKPYYSVKYVGLWPDPLLPGKSTYVNPGETQPLWITLYVPKETVPGLYKGELKIVDNGQLLKTLPINLKIFDFEIPKESHLRTAFDFYEQNTGKRIEQLKNESDSAYQSRIADLNELFLKEMVKHRMDPILNVDPIVNKDLARVDKYRWYGLSNFSIGKKGGTFDNNWPKTDEEIEKLLPLYRQYGELLALNKMLPFHYIYTWDEGEIGNPLVPKIANMIHRAYPKLKNMVCYHGFWEPDKIPGWGQDIDIWCFGIDDYEERKFNALKSLGKEMWLYVSGPGSSGAPNLAIDFDSIDYRIIPWMCWKFDIKGFLYWCVNWWVNTDPFKSAANTDWEQNGNGLLYYPSDNQPVMSIRTEAWRDGMEDYEYLFILKSLVEKKLNESPEFKNSNIYKNALNLLNVSNDLVTTFRNFNKDETELQDRRKAIGNMIENLQNNPLTKL